MAQIKEQLFPTATYYNFFFFLFPPETWLALSVELAQRTKNFFFGPNMARAPESMDGLNPSLHLFPDTFWTSYVLFISNTYFHCSFVVNDPLLESSMNVQKEFTLTSSGTAGKRMEIPVCRR